MTANKVSASDYGMLLTTLPGADEARRIAKLLVDERLAACVQLSAIESFYRWDGGVANEGETLLRIKTRTTLFGRAIARLKEIHPYTVPQIVGTAFDAGHPDYFAWIDDST